MKKILFTGMLALCLFALIPAAGCSRTPDLTKYVSEYRSDIFYGSSGDYSVFASCSQKEYPYQADGNAAEMSDMFELAFSTPDNTKTYIVQFSLGGKNYEGELSFDSVKMVHTWSQSISAPQEKEIVFTFTDTESDEASSISIQAESVKGDDVLSLSDLLKKVSAEEPEQFNELSDGNVFCAEIYVRLLYENNECYYYIGLTDRSGNTFAMLADAETGEVLATKQPRA